MNTMQLLVHIDEMSKTIAVPQDILNTGTDFFNKMDADMDKGWQMSRKWIEQPNLEQRCQIAADKLLTAVNTENETMIMLMVGYILSRQPKVSAVRIATDGEMLETELTIE